MNDMKKNKQLQSFSEEDQVLLDSYLKKSKEKQPPKIMFGEDRKVAPDAVTTAKLAEALGTTDAILTSKLLSQMIGFGSSTQLQEDRCNGALAILYGVKPKDELEAMLAVQMIGVHNLAMEFMGRVMWPDQNFDIVNQLTEMATKMLRTYSAQMEALNRHRGKGQQKVTVEYVHVHEGGQAIVGNVQSSKNERGRG